MINVHFITCLCREDVVDKLEKLVKSGIQEMTGITPAQSVVIPSHATHDNIYAYNHWLRDILNPRDPNTGKRKFHVGDRVVQLTNSLYTPCATVTNSLEELMAEPHKVKLKDRANEVYDLASKMYTHYGVYAGTEGVIIDINEAREEIRVFFDAGFVADYRFGPEAQTLDFAYASSLHRQQGKTHQAVILDAWQTVPCLMSENFMNTLINVAEKEVYILGDELSLKNMRDILVESTLLAAKCKICSQAIDFDLW